jgi:chemotaxis protein histidine kinase CheA
MLTFAHDHTEEDILHTTKGDLGLVGFALMLPLMQHVEDLLDMLRKGQIMYTSNMSDVVLQSMDQVKQFVKMCIQNGKTEYDDELLHNVIILVKDIVPNQHAENELILAQTAATLQGQSPQANTKLSIDVLNQASLTKSGIPKDLAPLLKVDMLFFRELMQPIENLAQKRALVAINKHYQGQFCPIWLGHFNQTLARVLVAHS